MTKINIVQAVNLALREEMARDKSVVVLGEDVGRNGGVFRATEGLLQEFGEERVIDTPLAESGIVGASIGMAVCGMRPVAEIQFDGFLYSALDQIISHAGRIRTRSRGRYHVPMVVRAPCSGGIHAPEHHSESPEAYFIHTPGIKVVMPSTPYDTKGLLTAAIRDPDPVIFLEPKKIYRAFKEEVPEGDYTIPLGEAKVVREGSALSIITWGAMVPLCKTVAEEAKGIDLEIIDLRTLSPMDVKAVRASVEKTGRAVIVHEAPRSCGLGAEVAALIGEKSLLYLKAPIERVAGFDTPFPLYKLEKYYLPDAARVMRAVERAMRY